MSKIENRDATIVALEETYKIDYLAEDIFDRGAGYLDELANKNFFLEAIKKYLGSASVDFQGDLENADDIFEFIKQGYEKSGVKGDKKKGEGSYNPSSLKEWISGKRLPSKSETQRIALCLGMNVLEATEFVFKGSLAKPFNFKEIKDSVYYFCINTGKTLKEALEIMEEIENSKVPSEKYPENDTVKIGEKVQEITAKEELIEYLAANKDGFAKQNQTALEMLKELIKISANLAEWERRNAKENFADMAVSEIKSEEDVAAILSVILGYEARMKIDGVEVYKKKISDSNFPDLIKNNFPQPQQLQKILTDNEGSAEAIRKAIILFAFYNIFAKLKKENKANPAVGFDTYSDTIDEILYKCGYVQMYWKHPYDWMFGYCAGAIDPLSELRTLIEAFYLDLEEIYSVENQFYKEK